MDVTREVEPCRATGQIVKTIKHGVGIKTGWKHKHILRVANENPCCCLPHPRNQISGGISRASLLSVQSKWQQEWKSSPEKRTRDISFQFTDAIALTSQAFDCLPIYRKKPSLQKKRGSPLAHYCYLSNCRMGETKEMG